MAQVNTPPVKFWELFFASRSDGDVLVSVVSTERWREPYLQYFLCFAQDAGCKILWQLYTRKEQALPPGVDSMIPCLALSSPPPHWNSIQTINGLPISESGRVTACDGTHRSTI